MYYVRAGNARGCGLSSPLAVRWSKRIFLWSTRRIFSDSVYCQYSWFIQTQRGPAMYFRIFFRGEDRGWETPEERLTPPPPPRQIEHWIHHRFIIPSNTRFHCRCSNFMPELSTGRMNLRVGSGRVQEKWPVDISDFTRIMKILLSWQEHSSASCVHDFIRRGSLEVKCPSRFDAFWTLQAFSGVMVPRIPAKISHRVAHLGERHSVANSFEMLLHQSAAAADSVTAPVLVASCCCHVVVATSAPMLLICSCCYPACCCCCCPLLQQQLLLLLLPLLPPAAAPVVAAATAAPAAADDDDAAAVASAMLLMLPLIICPRFVADATQPVAAAAPAAAASFAPFCPCCPCPGCVAAAAPVVSVPALISANAACLMLMMPIYLPCICCYPVVGANLAALLQLQPLLSHDTSVPPLLLMLPCWCSCWPLSLPSRCCPSLAVAPDVDRADLFRRTREFRFSVPDSASSDSFPHAIVFRGPADRFSHFWDKKNINNIFQIDARQTQSMGQSLK